LITDIATPREDGSSLIRRIRAIASIPVVAVTSFSSDDDRQRILNAGFQLHLANPADARSVARSVAAVVHRV
jgi:CheY-like chemotaxis protein